MRDVEIQGEEKCPSLELIKDVLLLREGISKALLVIAASYYANVCFELLRKIVQHGVSSDVIYRTIIETKNFILIFIAIVFISIIIKCLILKKLGRTLLLKILIEVYLHYYYDFKIRLMSYLANKINNLSKNTVQIQWDPVKYLKMFVLTLLLRLIGLGEPEFIREDAAILIKESNKPPKSEQLRGEKEYEPTEPMSSEATGKPLLIRTNHLKYSFYWKPFDYTISLLYGGVRLLNVMDNRGKRITLEVNLEKEENRSLSIYNNAGKVFIYEYYVRRCLRSKNCKKRLEKLASEVHNRIRKPITWKGTYEISSKLLPLRWASGGVLPIAYYKDNFWFVLFYRNFSPMCWNLPLGASETLSEQEKVDIMSTRESMEEILLVDGEPERGSEVTLKPIFPRTSLEFRYINEKIWPNISLYLKEYARLRNQQDDFSIKIPSDLGKTSAPAGEIFTSYGVKIKYKHKKEALIQNILFIINPEELGIEIIRPFIFLMNENDYILWGEIWKGASAIPRTPVLLLSVDYVRTLIREKGKFGEKLKGSRNRCLGCRAVDDIPKDGYILFHKDILFARERLKHLKGISSLSNKEKLEIESLKWHDIYRKQIDSLIRTAKNEMNLNRREHRIFLNFCPTTWRSFEILYSSDRLDNNFLFNMLRNLTP